MASPSTPAAAVDGGSLKLDSIPIVDLRQLSQSELYSLSMCTSSAFDPRRCDDVVIPKIDRSVFNESAGSRKQTYSRLRLAPPSSSSGAPRRRTPHLRPTVANIGNNYADPENAENTYIVTLLKQLFCSDTNPDELVPIKIDYSHSILPTELSSLTSSYAPNVVQATHKRKRGRPPKNKLLENGRELTAIDVSGVKDKSEEIRMMNEIVVRENMEDVDSEVVNRDGVAVDFVALGMVEHPYWEEIRRRTGMLRSEEELLGFLKELDGQWMSRRKKKRIVDASEFGSTLPIGWKLLLAVKKKSGRVWLYCRRYISPNGRQFMSCRDVSSYLLSLHCSQVTSLAQYKENVVDADKLTPVNIADHSVQDDNRKENLVFHTSSPAFASTSGNREMQIIINAGEPPIDEVRETLHCSNCNMTFGEKDELSQLQSSCHQKNRNKNGVRITDEVIIKEGKYECQFCHKSFSERHQYNGHVGAHVRYQAKIAGESEAVGEGEFVDPSSLNEVPVQDSMTKVSLGSERSNVAEFCYAVSNNGPNICSPCSRNNVRVRDLQKANVKMKVDEATKIETSANPSSVAEVVISSNENKSFSEAYGFERVKDGTGEIIGDGSSLQRMSGRTSPLLFDDATHAVMNSVIGNSASTENTKPDMISECSLLNSIKNVEACDVIVKNGQTCQARNELKLNAENFAVNESIFDFFGSHGGQAKDIATTLKQLSNYEDLSCENTCITHNTSTSVSVVSKLNEDSSISMLAPHDGKACAEASVPCSIGKFTVDETFSFGTCEKDSSEADNDAVRRQEEMQFGISSVIPSWNEVQESVSEKYDPDVSTRIKTNPGVQTTTRSMLVALSGYESNCDAENNNDEVFTGKIGVPEFDHIQNFGNGEWNDPFSSSHSALNSNSMTGTEQCRNLEVCSDFTSATDKLHFSEDNMMRAFNSALGEHKQEPFESILIGQSGVSLISDEAYTVNKIYTTPANQSKLNDIESEGKHELSLSFGSLERDLLKNSNRVEQALEKSFDTQTAVGKTCGFPTHVSNASSNVAADLKQGKTFGIDFLDSSFSDKTDDLGSSFNMAHPGRDWNGLKGDKIGTSGLNFMVDFGNSSKQSGESVKPDGSARTNHGNVFQDCFDALSSPQNPSSRCFRTFNATSDKVEEGSSRVNGSYDIQSEILRPGRTEPVEYSFMGELSTNSLPGESKNFLYNIDLEQGLDPSFWLGKDDLMPNADDSHQVTSLCVWCRNLFYHEPHQTGMQTGAIVSLCPSCSTRIPGQLNVL